MRSHTVICVALVVAVATALGGAAVAVAQEPAAHPRLLFSAADVPAMRARIAAGGVAQAAWQRLQAKAEGVLANVTPELIRAGTRFDQQNELNTYLIELGLAYQLSGDERFGRRVVDLLSAIGDAGYPFWSAQDLGIGDLLEGIGLGFDWSHELMTATERERIVGDLAASALLLFDRPLLHPTNVSSTYPTSNWMGVTAGGAGLALLAIESEPGAPARSETYLQTALEKVRTYFLGAFDPTGAGHEGLAYANYGTKNAVPFALAARRTGHGDLLAGTGLRNMARWAAFEQLPGEAQNFLALNDSPRSHTSVDLWAMQFAIDPGNGVAQWIWNRTVGPGASDCYNPATLPAACDVFNLHGNAWTLLFYRTPEETPEVDPATAGPLSVHHSSRGLVDARTGFAGGASEMVSTFEARRDGIGHFQLDLGSFTLHGLGGRWAIDPGYACVACGDTNEAGYATGHNVIVVDGSQFTQSVDSRYFTGTTIDRFADSPHASLAHADLRYAYDASTPYAGRDHFFSRAPGRPVLLAIADQVQRRPTGTFAYTWQMLTQQDNVVAPSGASFRITSPGGAVLAGRSAAGGAAAQDPSFTVRSKVLTNPAGEGGALVVSSTTPKQPALDQLTVMAVTPAGHPAATTSTLRVTGGNAIEVVSEGARDVVVRRLAGSSAVSGPVATDGTFGKLMRGGGETVLRGGTRLVADGRAYVTVTGSSATTMVGGDQVQSAGQDANRYRVFAPQPIHSALVNGESAPLCRQGLEVVFPCPGGHADPLASRLVAEPALVRTSPLAVPLLKLTSTLTRADTGQPLRDQPVSFSARGVALCSEVTDVAGTATCSATGGALQILLAGGYTASFGGSPDVAPASAAGTLLR